MKSRLLLVLFSLLFFAMTAAAQPKYGGDAIEIALPSVNGDTIRLSSLKGKVVLLDFWASWCGPCRTANRVLAKLYSKYRDKGFEIYGVSLDDSPQSWKKAIAKDKVRWLQVIDPGGWEASTAVNWSIYALPTSYLIDQHGKLIAMDLEPKELEKTLKSLLGEVK
jgi:thiol-disulfide isomerase/thioredoxin